MNEDVDLGEVPKVVVGGGTQAPLIFKFKWIYKFNNKINLNGYINLKTKLI